ncbi:MAG: glycosyltransferase family 2 protein [Nocardioidaceae bacterium]
MSPSARPSRGRRPFVTAVIVSHDGHRWLPRLIESLERSARLPDRLVAVDTGSNDGSADLLTAALGRDAVVTTNWRTGFGAAVQLGLGRADTVAPPDDTDHWVWVLHDDLALDAGALEQLLAAVDHDPELDLVGPKVREWPQRKRLLEVGLTITGTARRDRGVDAGEYDQGQHDHPHRTLAVGSAGLLVRREVWDRLDGFDPTFKLFGDDIDFGWRAARAGYQCAVCPEAVVYHVEAAARGRRDVDVAYGRAAQLDRQHALFTVLANCHAAAVPFAAVRLLLGSVLRALGMLLIRDPVRALDELLAVASVLLRPDLLLAARARRRRTASVPPSKVRPLLAPWWAPYRRGLDSVGQVVSEGYEAVAQRRTGSRVVVESGPAAEESENLDPDSGLVAWLVRNPVSGVIGLLVLVALFAGTVDLFGGGVLRGGALLPAPPGVGDWWRLYIESWHPVATGSDVPAPPYVALLATLGTLLLGQEWLVVLLLVGMAVPLTTLFAYLVSRRFLDAWPVRIWAAASYGLLPVLTGAVGQGRLGTIAATMLAPLAVWAVARSVDAPTSEQRFRRGLVAGIVLSMVVAFAPASWLVAALVVVGLLVLAVTSGDASGPALSGLVAVVALPLLLLLPWTLHLGLDPARWLTDVGFAGGVESLTTSSAWALGLGRPGGPFDAPAWLSIGVLLGAVVALARADRRRAVLAAWGVGLAALVVVMLQRSEGIWPGLTVVVLHGAAITATAIGADGVLGRLGDASFGWRQPLAVLVAVAATLTPVLGLGWWVAADDGLVQRREPVDIPAFMADGQLDAGQPRTLVLGTGRGVGFGYHLSRGPGMFIGQDAVVEPDTGLSTLVGRLVTDPSARDVADLADAGVTYIVLREADDDVASAIDAAPGIERASAGESGAAAWRVGLPAGGARLVSGRLTDAKVLPSSAGGVDTDIDGGKDRRVLLAERSGPGWRATLGGAELEAGASGEWTQSFAVSDGGGRLEVTHGNGRGWWLTGQILLVVLAVVFAAPSQGRPDPRRLDEDV